MQLKYCAYQHFTREQADAHSSKEAHNLYLWCLEIIIFFLNSKMIIYLEMAGSGTLRYF